MIPLRNSRHESSPWVADGTTLVTAVLVFSIVVPSRFVIPPLGAVGRPDILLGVGLALWWLFAAMVPSLAPTGRNPLRWVLSYRLVILLLSLVVAYGRPLSALERSGMERAVIGAVSATGIILICSEGITTRARLDILLKRLTYLGGFLAAVGTLQFVANIDISPYLALPGLGLNQDLLGIGSRSIFNRVSGTSIHAIEYGAVLALILPVAIHYAVHAKTRGESHLRWALAGFIFVSGLYSISRTNTVAVSIVLGLVVSTWALRQRLNAIVAGGAALAVLHTAIPGLLGTIQSLFEGLGNDPSIQGRTGDYPLAFRYISERPFLGRGAGTWNVEEYFILDNNWLGTLLQTGWLGIIAEALLLLLPFVMARHLLHVGRDNEFRHLGGAVAAQLLMAITVGFFFDSGGFPQFNTIQMVMIGVVGAMWRIENRHDPIDDRTDVRSDLLKRTLRTSEDPKRPEMRRLGRVPAMPLHDHR